MHWIHILSRKHLNILNARMVRGLYAFHSFLIFSILFWSFFFLSVSSKHPQCSLFLLLLMPFSLHIIYYYNMYSIALLLFHYEDLFSFIWLDFLWNSNSNFFYLFLQHLFILLHMLFFIIIIMCLILNSQSIQIISQNKMEMDKTYRSKRK